MITRNFEDMNSKQSKDLYEKYNVPAPRYTSYPTVPFWQKEPPKEGEWFRAVDDCLATSNEISLYIHLPFCERLCTYCGCNTKITRRHEVEEPYIKTLWKEWEMYVARFPEKPILKELHIGGGTPTFFSPTNLKRLLSRILDDVIMPEEHDYGFEAHPNSTTSAHLEELRALGFNRISIGVQDFNQEILKVIHRFQTTEQIEQITKEARNLGYESVNYDLIYGLPLQKLEDIAASMNRLEVLKPDRLAFYSYAHVPWIKGSQRAYSEEDLPSPQEKRALYEYGKEHLLEMGYQEIGLDHFALPTDSLYKAVEHKELHRNFMGYTPVKSNLLIGLGASAISDAGTAYIQNEKNVKLYQEGVSSEELPIFKGHLLTKEDQLMRKHINQIMCAKHTVWGGLSEELISQIKAELEGMAHDGLLEFRLCGFSVTHKGLPFLRNISMAFDLGLKRRELQKNLFSKAI